jgi:Zn-dependent protease
MVIIDALVLVAIIIMSSVVHEVMHGVMADWLGDKTARYAGRLTLNPIVHMDPFGSVLLPLVFILSHSPLFFGYAKPVPYNPYNLRPGRFSEALVAIAGPASNLVIAILFGSIIRLHLMPFAESVFWTIVSVNIMLCFFNLIPIPPLDGSKVLSSLLPNSLAFEYNKLRTVFESNPLMGMVIAILLLNVFGGYFYAFLQYVTQFIV